MLLKRKRCATELNVILSTFACVIYSQALPAACRHKIQPILILLIGNQRDVSRRRHRRRARPQRHFILTINRIKRRHQRQPFYITNKPETSVCVNVPYAWMCSMVPINSARPRTNIDNIGVFWLCSECVLNVGVDRTSDSRRLWRFARIKGANRLTMHE